MRTVNCSANAPGSDLRQRRPTLWRSCGSQVPVSTGGFAAPQNWPFLAYQRALETYSDHGWGLFGTTAWLLEPMRAMALSIRERHAFLSAAILTVPVPTMPMALRFLEPMTPPWPPAECE